MAETEMIKSKCGRNACGAGGGTSHFSATPQDSNKYRNQNRFCPEVLARWDIFLVLKEIRQLVISPFSS